ncbi:MAG: hypothetical protein NVSMB25_23620 [Thermoleophilaceae bacterium]
MGSILSRARRRLRRTGTRAGQAPETSPPAAIDARRREDEAGDAELDALRGELVRELDRLAGGSEASP